MARLSKLVSLVALAVLSVQPLAPSSAEEQTGITHTPLLKSTLPTTPDQEVIVWDTVYGPGAINPRHLHPAAITFHVVSGTGVWQEDGKPPVTLRAGDSLFVPAGTIHTHMRAWPMIAVAVVPFGWLAFETLNPTAAMVSTATVLVVAALVAEQMTT